MTQAEFGRMLENLASGWTTRDYDSVIGFFSEDVVYSDPKNYYFSDKPSLHKFFLDDGGMEQECTFRRFLFDEREQFGCAEYSYEGTHRYHGSVWIELVHDKISSWREYQHRTRRNWEQFWNINERDRP